MVKNNFLKQSASSTCNGYCGLISNYFLFMFRMYKQWFILHGKIEKSLFRSWNIKSISSINTYCSRLYSIITHRLHSFRKYQSIEMHIGLSSLLFPEQQQYTKRKIWNINCWCKGCTYHSSSMCHEEIWNYGEDITCWN